MKKILIFGIGLIGGSIALKIKEEQLFDEVIGWVVREVGCLNHLLYQVC